MSELHSASVDLAGLLTVLGENLYSTPDVALRELVQNAHDSCNRRRIEQGPFEPRIDLATNNGKLTVSDNGSGLTHQEIIDYLATVGAGYTRLLKNAGKSEDLIGQFGLGFLVNSCRIELGTPEQEDTFGHLQTRVGNVAAINLKGKARVAWMREVDHDMAFFSAVIGNDQGFTQVQITHDGAQSGVSRTGDYQDMGCSRRCG